jgi:hypothetical protein
MRQLCSKRNLQVVKTHKQKNNILCPLPFLPYHPHNTLLSLTSSLTQAASKKLALKERCLLKNNEEYGHEFIVLTLVWYPASCTMGTGGSFPGGKARPGRGADRSPPSSADI